jgi:hypothetical protein
MHTGSIDGQIAIIGLVPDLRLGVYVLANLDHAELRHALMYRVFDMYSGGARRDWSAEFRTLYGGFEQQGRQAEASFRAARVAGTRPSAPLEKYVGTYVDSLYGTMRITSEGGRLQAAFGTGLSGALEHWHYDTFLAHWEDRRSDPSPLTFVLDAAGMPGVVELRGLGAPVRFIRRSER